MSLTDEKKSAITNNPLWNFFVEVYKRMRAKSPKFFVVIQNISIAAGLITGIPEMLEFFQIPMPDTIQALANKVISIASVVSFIISKLPVDSAIVVEDTAAVPAGQTTSFLPFTQITLVTENNIAA